MQDSCAATQGPVAILHQIAARADAARRTLARALESCAELPPTIAAEVGPLLDGQVARLTAAARSLHTIADSYGALLEDPAVAAVLEDAAREG